MSKTNSTKTIYSTLGSFNIPLEVENFASKYANQNNKNIKRGKKLKQYLFYCTVAGYYNQKIEISPYVLGKKIGLTLTEVKKIFGSYTFLQITFNPSSLLKDVASYLNITLDTVTINTLLKEFGNIDIDPFKISSVMLWYFISINDIKIDLKLFKDLTGFSVSSASKFYSIK